MSRILKRPLEQILLDALATVFPSLEDIPPEMRPELSAMTYLSDEALHTLANAQMPTHKQEVLHRLLSAQGCDELTSEHKTELAQLMLEHNQFMLHRAQASALLHNRRVPV